MTIENLTPNEVEITMNPIYEYQSKVMDFLFDAGYEAAKNADQVQDDEVDREIEQIQLEHDCHKSPEDGCPVCDVE